MSSPRKVFSRGATLLEVLFASFLLITALSLTIFLIHHSFQSEADSGLKVRALHDAQNALEEIRAVAYADFKGGLGSVDGRLWPCTLPDYLIESSAKWQPLDLPCSELESQYDEGRALPNLARKVLTQSTWKVDVEVRRKDDGKPLLHLTTLVADLAPDTFELRMLAPDGLKVDERGNLWATGPGGVWVIGPDGQHLGTIKPTEVPANVAWGDVDGRTLYMTARTGLYRIRVNVAGDR